MEEPMYIVMELVSGGDLLNTLRDAKVDNVCTEDCMYMT